MASLCLCVKCDGTQLDSTDHLLGLVRSNLTFSICGSLLVYWLVPS